MTRSFRYHLGWIAVVFLILLLAALVPLWLWSRDRAIAREKSEKAAVAALELLVRLQADYRRGQLHDIRKYWTGGVSEFLGYMMATTMSFNTPMPPAWDEIYQGDVRGKARPTSYGYLFEALPAKGFRFRAYPANDAGLREFVVDETGQVIAK